MVNLLKAFEMLVGVALVLLSTVMFKWWLEADETFLRLVQIALYAVCGIVIIVNDWRWWVMAYFVAGVFVGAFIGCLALAVVIGGNRKWMNK